MTVKMGDAEFDHVFGNYGSDIVANLRGSCEFLRGLWAGSFKEASHAAALAVEDKSDARAAELLIKVCVSVVVKKCDNLPRLW